jgi:hypothetical protein
VSPRVIRWLVIVVFVAGIAGMIIGSIADNNGVAITFGLTTAVAAVGLILVTAVAGPEAFRKPARPTPVAAEEDEGADRWDEPYEEERTEEVQREPSPVLAAAPPRPAPAPLAPAAPVAPVAPVASRERTRAQAIGPDSAELERAGALVEEQVYRLVAAGYDESELRELIRRSVNLGRLNP